ncbi:unnamed protein product [Clonostachys rosea f. rosea IK726]|uniref:Uncharacterized protein n=2 Tax=Bionectria ochroleuca TaxID=29856 RepID=A0A0B7KCF1_BIOOC|nr:unnamed protein product [Clonostachys rosea f. rosea IK726]
MPKAKEDSRRKLHEQNAKRSKHRHETRPPVPERSNTQHSRYVQMLLSQDTIPRWHNISAAFCVWLLLAGFLVFPGTFTSIQDSLEESGDDTWSPDKTAGKILDGVKNIPLLVIATVCCAVAAIGMIILALVHVRNYIWLVNRLFMPGMANSLAGLISTLISVYTQKNGDWSITARVTIIVEGSYMFVCLALFLLVNQIFLRKVKQSHGSHYEQWFGIIGESTEVAEKTKTVQDKRRDRIV